MKHQGYFTRALKANDPRYARVFGKLGYGRSDLAAEEPAGPTPEDELHQLREAYQAKVGKRPYHGWDAAELREKISAAEQAQD